MIKKLFLLFCLCLILLLSLSASAEFKGLHPPMEIEPEVLIIDNMVFIKGGCYEMGDTFGDGDEDERPVHTVCVDNFYMGKYEVTHKEWIEVMDSNSSQEILGSLPSWDEVVKKPLYNDLNEEGKAEVKRQYAQLNAKLNYRITDSTVCPNCPVMNVSWDDVQKFINRLNNKTGKKYRLPTEAEWEYAARSGGKKERFAGFSDENQLYLYANFCDSNCEWDFKTKDQNDGYKDNSPVGSYRPNGLGLYDMTGNVREWVNDRYDVDFYKISFKHNPMGPLRGEDRVMRGGSHGERSLDTRSSMRSSTYPSGWGSNVGFRLALSSQ